MLRNRMKNATRIGIGGTAMLTVCAGGVLAQLPASNDLTERQIIAHAEVTANDVYVRSGPSLNHYTICKLKAGDRVRIVGESSDWFEILPPDGTFSLISGDYVDTADDRTGVVNGENVRVRAGSLLNDNKYTVQTMVSKGSGVTILGRNPDGFLRVVPPAGATLWITRQFIEPIPDELMNLEAAAGRQPVTSVATQDGAATDGSRPADTAPVPGDQTDQPVISSALAALPRTSQRATLEKIDADTRKELTKPIAERKLEPLIERYRAVASQDQDDMSRRYAEARAQQLTDAITLMDTVKQMRRLGDRADSTRREFLEARAQIPVPTVPTPSGLDAQGELRVSALYPPGSIPRRYRLVDASGPTDRTIAYIEFPDVADVDPDQYIGRHVGVRAAEKRWQRGGVDPIPVYVVKELVALADEAAPPPPAPKLP
jgi:uncharacterized protein YgiM (DUF1202 family)